MSLSFPSLKCILTAKTNIYILDAYKLFVKIFQLKKVYLALIRKSITASFIILYFSFKYNKDISLHKYLA